MQKKSSEKRGVGWLQSPLNGVTRREENLLPCLRRWEKTDRETSD